MNSKPGSLVSLTRFGGWWNHKISYLFVPFYLMLPQAGLGLPAALASFAALAGYFIGTAVFGHLLNDLSDVRLDIQSAKINACHHRPKSMVVAVALLACCFAFGCLIFAGASTAVLVLASVEVLLFVAYSLPPFRLKESASGLFADACYAHVVPFTIAALLLGPVSGSAPAESIALLAIALVWQLLAGLRGIIGHQIEDHRSDAAAGVRTAVVRLGAERAGAIVRRIIAPSETILFTACLILLVPQTWLPAAGFVIQVALATTALRRALYKDLDWSAWDRWLDPFYRRLLPLLVLSGIILENPVLWPFLPLHLVLFHSNRAAGGARRALPPAILRHRLVRDGEGFILVLEGCYLTSQLTSRTGVNIFLVARIDGRRSFFDFDYAPNDFAAFYRDRNIEEVPVCFAASLPLPLPRKGRTGWELSLEARWKNPDEAVNLDTRSIEPEPIPSRDPSQ